MARRSSSFFFFFEVFIEFASVLFLLFFMFCFFDPGACGTLVP